MDEQGRSTLATDDDGRILDRLAGLEKVVAPELMRQVLEETGRVNGRACPLTHEVVLWVVLAMGLLTHLPIRQVFRHARRLRRDERTPARSSLCEARKRLGVEPLRVLHQRVARPLATPETPGAFYRGFRLMGIDLPDDALLLEDRGFFCYDDWKALNSRVKLLVRLKNNLILRPIERLADGSYPANRIWRRFTRTAATATRIATGSWCA